jgi:ABC-type Zn uptake system ZnuABC Zn-binding protein ZnuA
MVTALRQADLVIRVGMELDLFMDSLVEVSKNPKIQKGNPGNLDASEGVTKKEVPSGKIDLSMGDVHAQGNPHYQTDPENVRRVALALGRRLGQLDPAHAAEYGERAEAYGRKVGAAGARWAEALAPFRGAPVVTYHPSWIYFTERFGLKVIGTIEPKPGIPPGAAHLKRLQDLMKSEKARAILVEPYFDFGVAKRVGTATGAPVLLFPQTAGGAPGTETWIALMERNVALLAQTLK